MPFENKLKEELDKLSTKLKQAKITKFDRDCYDYVGFYIWLGQERTPDRKSDDEGDSSNDCDKRDGNFQMADANDRNVFFGISPQTTQSTSQKRRRKTRRDERRRTPLSANTNTNHTEPAEVLAVINISDLR